MVFCRARCEGSSSTYPRLRLSFVTFLRLKAQLQDDAPTFRGSRQVIFYFSSRIFNFKFLLAFIHISSGVQGLQGSLLQLTA